MRKAKLAVNGRPSGFAVSFAESLKDRLIGLMGKRDAENVGLYLTGCSSIHTFFMRFPIDAVFLGKDMKVVRIMRGLAPWRVVLPVRGAGSVLELAGNASQRFGISEGASLSFEND
ncbi:MAG: DUF192 domain-containing protein [Endomicrobiales bacterium]|nr:DUF192 domain-containing protein [Endomicrobiales bacterium]